MSATYSIDDVLSFIEEDDLVEYLQRTYGYWVFSDYELDQHDQDVGDSAVANEILLSNCSDWQFEDEAEQRGYSFYTDNKGVEKIVQLIREGNQDWQKLAIEYFAELKGVIL